RRVRIVEAAVVFSPVLVPRTGMIWDRIVVARILADPKNGGHDLSLPRIRLARRWRGRSQTARGKGKRFNPDPRFVRFFLRLLTQLHLGRLGFRDGAMGKKRRNRGE